MGRFEKDEINFFQIAQQIFEFQNVRKTAFERH